MERAAAEVVLLDAMQSYFEYRCYTGCGIPSITLEGTDDDWKTLADRVQGFREFGLGSWLDVLSPILDQFARASQGDVDPAFWRSIYKFNSMSGGAVINGWITAFFPYARDHETGCASVPHRVLFGNDRDLLASMLYPREEFHWDTPGSSMRSFPQGRHTSQGPVPLGLSRSIVRHGVPRRVRGRRSGPGYAHAPAGDRLGCERGTGR